jgi:hypothetical protein
LLAAQVIGADQCKYSPQRENFLKIEGIPLCVPLW